MSYSQVLRRIILSLFLLLALEAAGIAVFGLMDDARPSDVAIVLGSKVNPDGSLSPRLQARLDKTVELYRQNLMGNIIVSGGLGQEGFDEAMKMREYLVQQNIPASLIVTDSHGVNTSATAVNSAAIMRERGWRSAIVVTQFFHLARSRLVLHRNGIAPVSAAHADFFEPRDVYSLFRETIACLSALGNLSGLRAAK